MLFLSFYSCIHAFFLLAPDTKHEAAASADLTTDRSRKDRLPDATLTRSEAEEWDAFATESLVRRPYPTAFFLEAAHEQVCGNLRVRVLRH